MDMMKNSAIQLHGSAFFPIADFPVAVVPSGNQDENFGGEGYTCIPHFHDYHELVMIVSGSGVQNIDGRDYTVKAGDVFLIGGSSVHCFRAVRALRLYNILFDPDRLPLPLAQFRKIHGYEMIFRTEPQTRTPRNFRNHLRLESRRIPELVKLVEGLRETLARNDEFSEAESIGLLIRIILDLARQYAPATPAGASLPQISRVIARMEHDYAKPFRLEELAQFARTSPRNFSRQFRRITGNSPIDYLLKIRLRRAAGLLLNGSWSMAEIADRCGFRDSNYFTKRFTREYGCSPRAFRRQSGTERSIPVSRSGRISNS